MHLLESRSTKHWSILVLAIVLILGIFFRISNLDVKPIWVGEADTFSIISGYSESEVIDKILTVGAAQNSPVEIGTFLKYRYPNSEKNIGEILHKLSTRDRAPLYYLLARYWVELFGSSVTTLRSVSAVLSLLAMPCIYWLCLELFEVPLIGWMAMALLAVSPIQVIYAQDAGSNSLFIVVVLLSGAALLWALRTQKQLAWAIYMVALILGLYTQYLFILVVLGYLIYVLSIESWRFTRRLRWFWLTTCLGFLTFIPWLAIVMGHISVSQVVSHWKTQTHLTIPGAIALWAENISLIFMDLVDPKASEYSGFGKFGFYLLTPLIIALVGYSIYLLRSITPKRAYLFILISIGSTAFPLITIDAILGGNQQIWPTNLFPCFLGIQISVAHLLSSQLFLNFSRRNWYRKLWLAIVTFIITIGIIFCAFIGQADTWWNHYGGEDTLSFTQIVGRAKNPLIVVDRQRLESIIFYNLKPEVKLLFIQDEKLALDSFPSATDVFFVNPNPALQAELKLLNYDLNLLVEFPNPDRVYDLIKPPQLWKLSNKK